MAKYLVTGGAGFIGSHLVEALIKNDHEVIVLDNLSTGKRENLPQSDLVTMVTGNVVNKDIVEETIKDIDGCYHLAAVASVQKSIKEWANTHKVNVTGAINIFDAISKMDKKIPVVYASSAAVYGNSKETPLIEDDPIKPVTSYGVDKYSCELHARIARVIHSIPSFGLRFFNVYGDRQDPSSPYSGVISIFIDSLVDSKDIRVFGDGTQMRDFIHVSDVVKGLLISMEKIEKDPAGNFVSNLCTGNGTTVNKLITVLENIIGVEAKVKREKSRRGDIRISIGDPSNMEKLLGIKETLPIEEGLAITLEALGKSNKKVA